MRTNQTRGVLAAGALLAALWAPAAASAAEKPVVTTRGVANVAPTSAVLNGTVNPKQAATTYFFQIGTTRLYGTSTTPTSAGSGNSGVRVAVPVGALAPATTYHYRIVARNRKGLSLGRDRTFKTRRQPLGVSLAATPNPVFSGGSATLGGVLTGTGNANRQVTLQYNPWPYTQGFLAAANVQLTNSQGGFSFPILSVPVNTQYRVLMPARPEVVSPVVVVGTTMRVTTNVDLNRGPRRGRIRFSGRIAPAVDGRQVLIQKRRRGVWVTIADTFARHAGGGRSRYRKSVRVRRGGRFRVVANVADLHVPSAGRTVRIRRVRS